jgi:hypothetical protein
MLVVPVRAFHCFGSELYHLLARSWKSACSKVALRGKKDMQKILLPITLFGLFSMSAVAASYSGKLLDSSCYDQQKKVESCDATVSTTTFAIVVNGKVYKLDNDGNSKASAAIKNRADRSDPSKPQPKEVVAKVDSTEQGGIITVDSIDVQ